MARLSLLCWAPLTWVLAGCNLIFGIQDGMLEDTGAGGEAATTSTGGGPGQGGSSSSQGGAGQGGAGEGCDLCGGALAQDDNPCTHDQCDGNGDCVHPPYPDPPDLPDDGKPCTQNVCQDINEYPLYPSGQSCGGGKVCDNAGNCVECVTSLDCTGTLETICNAGSCVECVTTGDCGSSTSCGNPFCDPGFACDWNYAAMGTVVMSDGANGNCTNLICTGVSENPIQGPDNMDVPMDDATDCLIVGCNGGMTTVNFEPQGTACGTGGGKVCRSGGACVDCLSNMDCAFPGSSTPVCNSTNTCVQCVMASDCGMGPCGTATCNAAQVCSWTYAVAGTFVADNGTNGDCQSIVCTGTSQTAMEGADDLDIPGDLNPTDCTLPTCSGGVPTPLDADFGATCNDGAANEAEGTCNTGGTNGVCYDCNPTGSVGCDPGHPCIFPVGGDPACCTPLTRQQACVGQCGTSPSDGCGGSYTCDCSEAAKGAFCDTTTNICGCVSPSDCDFAGFGTRCFNLASPPRCGCNGDAECSNNSNGSACDPITSKCHCTDDAHCTTISQGHKCFTGPEACGCDLDSDCDAGFTCDPVNHVCV